MNDPEQHRWWKAAAELELVVRCEGADHRLLWSEGEVKMLDHPDLEAELAMVALGGSEPPCVANYRLWDEAVVDGGFLGEWVDETRLTGSWFSWLTMALERMRSEGFHEFLRRLPPARAQRMGEFLHVFPVSWIDRAAATVSDRVVEGGGVKCSLAPELLIEAISQRVRRAFVDAVGSRQLSVGAAALVPLSVVVGTDAKVSGMLTGPQRGITLVVPRGWIHEVWAAQAAVIDGGLVLSVFRSEGLTARAMLVRWTESQDGFVPKLQELAVRFENNTWVADGNQSML